MGVLTEVTGLVWPVRCAGCGAADVAVCGRCGQDLAGPAGRVELAAWAGGAWVRAEYAGEVLPRLLPEWKDRGRVDVGRVLAPALAGACAAALRAVPPGPVRLVAVPSSRAARRRRGADVVADLARAAAPLVARGTGRPVTAGRLLRHRRRVAEQSGLGAGARRRNLEGSYAAAGVRPGESVLVVDDVVTTGASVAEAARALTSAGASVVGVAALAATPGPGRAA